MGVVDKIEIFYLLVISNKSILVETTPDGDSRRVEEQQNRDLIDHRNENVTPIGDAVPTIILTPDRIDNIRNEHYKE